MAWNPSIQSALCIVWKTFLYHRNTQHIDSSPFDFMNSTWSLRITSHNSQSGSIFNLHLTNCNRENPCKPFQVKTYLENYLNCFSLFCSTTYVSSSFGTLYLENIDVIKEKLDLLCGGRLDITCVISSPNAGFVDCTAERVEKSTQSSVECRCLNKNSLSPADGSTDDGSELSMKHVLHLQTLSTDLGGILQTSVMTDVQLKCGEVAIPAHKAVLASRSKVFSSMFQHEMVENISSTVDLPDIEPSTLGEFLRYLYTGAVPEDLSAEVAVKLYETSDKYAVYTLQEECAQILFKKLNEENFIQFLMLSEEHGDPKLKDAVTDFLIQHPVLMTTDKWMKFSDDFSKTAMEIYKKYMKLTLSK